MCSSSFSRHLGILLLAAAALHGAPRIAMAATSCDAVLVDGTMQRFNRSENFYARSIYAYQLSQMTENEARNRLEHHGQFWYGGMTMRGDFSRDDFRRFQTVVNQQMQADQMAAHSAQVAVVTGDQGVLNAWSACINSPGLHITPRETTPRHVELTIVLRPIDGDRGAGWVATEAAFYGRNENNVVRQGEQYLLPNGPPVPDGRSVVILIERNPEVPFVFAMNTTRGPASAYLPARRVEIRPPSGSPNCTRWDQSGCQECRFAVDDFVGMPMASRRDYVCSGMRRGSTVVSDVRGRLEVSPANFNRWQVVVGMTVNEQGNNGYSNGYAYSGAEGNNVPAMDVSFATRPVVLTDGIGIANLHNYNCHHVPDGTRRCTMTFGRGSILTLRTIN